jgi:hypothetical protein
MKKKPIWKGCQSEKTIYYWIAKIFHFRKGKIAGPIEKQCFSKDVGKKEGWTSGAQGLFRVVKLFYGTTVLDACCYVLNKHTVGTVGKVGPNVNINLVNNMVLIMINQFLQPCHTTARC